MAWMVYVCMYVYDGNHWHPAETTLKALIPTEPWKGKIKIPVKGENATYQGYNRIGQIRRDKKSGEGK